MREKGMLEQAGEQLKRNHIQNTLSNIDILSRNNHNSIDKVKNSDQKQSGPH